jgi:hypothetical protein
MGLLLNFSPIQFDDAHVDARVFSYGTDGEQVLKALRQQHWRTHVFRRDGPTEIVAVPVVADAPQIGTGPKRIRLKENLGITASLIRNSLINYLDGFPRTVLNYDPVRFVAQDDILRGTLPAGTVCPDWLAVRLLYEMAVRPIYFFKHEPFIAAVFDVRTTRILERTVADLFNDGFSPVGHYVAQRKSKYEDTRIAAHAELVGKVTAVKGSELALTDSKDEIQSIDSSQVWLEKRAFHDYLAYLFKEKAEGISKALEKARADLRSGPAKLQRINSVVGFFASKQHFLAPGIAFRFLPLLSNSAKALFPALETAPKPIYVFDQTGSKTDTWNDRGLEQHGPYTSKVFTPNRPRLCVICQKTQKGRVE